MKLNGFIVRDFNPRENMIEDGQKVVFEALKHIPIEGSVKVAIIDQGTSFLVSVVAFSDKKIFSSESVQFKNLTTGRTRNWLIQTLDFVLNDFVKQVRSRFTKSETLLTTAQPESKELQD